MRSAYMPGGSDSSRLNDISSHDRALDSSSRHVGHAGNGNGSSNGSNGSSSVPRFCHCTTAFDSPLETTTQHHLAQTRTPRRRREQTTVCPFPL